MNFCQRVTSDFENFLMVVVVIFIPTPLIGISAIFVVNSQLNDTSRKVVDNFHKMIMIISGIAFEL